MTAEAELLRISEALVDALREAHELARAGESGEPLRETLHYACDLLDLANETLAGDPQVGEHARGMADAHGGTGGSGGGSARANSGGVMTVTLQLANQVRRLGRENLTVEQIARRLALPEMAIMDALSMLGLPLPGEMVEERPGPDEEQRAAFRAKMPKHWQDRLHNGKP